MKPLARRVTHDAEPGCALHMVLMAKCRDINKQATLGSFSQPMSSHLMGYGVSVKTRPTKALRQAVRRCSSSLSACWANAAHHVSMGRTKLLISVRFRRRGIGASAMYCSRSSAFLIARLAGVMSAGIPIWCWGPKICRDVLSLYIAKGCVQNLSSWPVTSCYGTFGSTTHETKSIVKVITSCFSGLQSVGCMAFCTRQSVKTPKGAIIDIGHGINPGVLFDVSGPNSHDSCRYERRTEANLHQSSGGSVPFGTTSAPVKKNPGAVEVEILD